MLMEQAPLLIAYSDLPFGLTSLQVVEARHVQRRVVPKTSLQWHNFFHLPTECYLSCGLGWVENGTSGLYMSHTLQYESWLVVWVEILHSLAALAENNSCKTHDRRLHSWKCSVSIVPTTMVQPSAFRKWCDLKKLHHQEEHKTPHLSDKVVHSNEP